MPRQRVWLSLSQATRRRYERAGITPATYEAGVDLRAARGHATTPERPERAARSPERYSSYLNRNKRRHTILLYTTNGIVRAYVPLPKDRSVAGRYMNYVNPAINRYERLPAGVGGIEITGYRLTSSGYETKPTTFLTEPDEQRLIAHVLEAADDGLIATSLYTDRVA